MKKILLGVLFFAYLQTSFGQLRVDASSQLHIGGTSPTERLDVNGAIRIGTTANTNAGAIRYLSNVFEGYNGTEWINLSNPSKWTLTGTDLSYNIGDVGIGTSSPAAKLDINGDALINGIDIGRGNNELSENTVFGALSGEAITTGNFNTFIGKAAGLANTSGDENVFIGKNAGLANTSGRKNVILGNASGRYTISGDENVFIGHTAGLSNTTGTGNVFIGHQAGYYFVGSNKLAIDNENTNDPLIFGNFSTDEITINGSLGIGTTSPDYELSIKDVTEGGGIGVMRRALVGNYSAIRLGADNAGASSSYKGGIFFEKNSSNGRGDLHFATVNSLDIESADLSDTRMTITYNGNVGIAMTSPSVELDVTGDIEYTGTLTDVSDRRLKKDIEPLQNSLEKILKINPVSFKMKADEKGRTQLGVIAQNVKEHFPQVVSIIDPVNGFLGVDYTQLIAPLIGAIQAQQAQIEQLQKEVKKLKKL